MSAPTDIDEDRLTEVRNEWPEYLHDIGRCEDDCPFCPAPSDSSDERR